MEAILIFLYVYAFVVGSCIASFINVVIYRVPLSISVVKGRSFCPECHHQLHALDLIPIVSYIFLRGQCRYCHAKIPIRDTLLEVLGGLLGMLCFYRFGFGGMTFLSFAFAMVLLAIAIIDLDTMIIPDGLIICCLILVALSIPLMGVNVFDRMIGFVIMSVPMYLLNLVIPDCFGGGDIKLLAVCGLLMGWKNLLVGMFIAVVMAGSYATYLLITHKVDRKAHIAFGPYICIGVFVALLYGQEILNAYLGLFGF